MLRSWEKCQVWSGWDLLLWYSSACVTTTQSQLRTASSLVTNLIPSDSFHIISTSSPSRKKESCESGGWKWTKSSLQCWLLWQCGSHPMNLIVLLNWHCFLRVTEMINDIIQLSVVVVFELHDCCSCSEGNVLVTLYQMCNMSMHTYSITLVPLVPCWGPGLQCFYIIAFLCCYTFKST